ncbi:MAG: hypothetical protein ACREL5_05475 [Gemmatimonadales bacterium]
MTPLSRHRILHRLFLAGLVAVAGCTSTSLVNLWRDPGYPRQSLRNVLVVAIRHDPTSRRNWEDGFVKSLRDHGIDATPSYRYFPGQAPDTAQLTDAIRSRGYDAVLLTHPLPGATQSHYVPGYATVEPVTYLSPWTGHYYTYWTDVYSPGYVETNRLVRYANELITTRDGGRVIWSATTETINPTSGAQVNREIADAIVPELVKSEVIASR